MSLYFYKYRIFCSVLRNGIISPFVYFCIVYMFFGYITYANDGNAYSISSELVLQNDTLRIAMLVQDSDLFIQNTFSNSGVTKDTSYQCSFSGIDGKVIEKVRALLGNNVVCDINQTAQNSQELFALLKNNTVDIVIYSKMLEETISHVVLSSNAYVTMKTIAFVQYKQGSIFSNIPKNENVAVYTVSLYEKLVKSDFDKSIIPIYTLEDVLDQLQSRYIQSAFLNEVDAHSIIQKNPRILMYYKPLFLKDDYVLQRNMYVNNSNLLVVINSALQSVGQYESMSP